MGPRTEERTSTAIFVEVPGLIPTAEDAVIDVQDGQILQFVYSPNFQYVLWGASLTRLFKIFSATFGRSIAKPSLRQAILAWGAAFTPLPDHSGYDRMHECSKRAIKSIATKITATFEEADLFATFLLALLSAVYHDLITFQKHIYTFITIAREIRQRTGHNKCQLHLSTFWPLARDMILESFRLFPVQRAIVRPMVINFCYECHGTIGPQSLIRRADYLWEFFGFDPTREYAFSQVVWTYSRLLRVSFRATVYRQLVGEANMDPLIGSTVLELDNDLRSLEVAAIVSRIQALTSNEHLKEHPYVDARVDLLQYSVLVYRFCELLISLMNARTILDGLSKETSIRAALEIRDWIKPEPHHQAYWSQLPPRSATKWFTPRMLWTAGLCLGRGGHLQGVSSTY